MTDQSPSEINSRFKLLPVPINSPGKCACCGAVDRPVVDFGFALLGYGVVMLCTLCVSEAARKVGMVSENLLTDNQRAADLIVSEYLKDHELKVITNGQFELLLSAVAGFSEFASSSGDLVPKENTDDGVAELATVDAKPRKRPAKAERTDSDSAGGKGPDDLWDFTLGR